MPEGDLLDELLSLSEAANRTVDYLRAPNFPLPTKFPTEQLREICFSLGALHMGTAAGCRVPLEYARSRLPAIRAEHVPNSRKLTSTKDELSLQRGLGIDPHLADLIATVATSLDAFRRDYVAPVDDIVVKDSGISTAGIENIDSTLEEGLRVDRALEDVRVKSSKIVREALEAENFQRKISDAKSLNLLALAELRGRVVLRWFRPIVSSLQKYPEMIRLVGKAVQGATELSRPAVKEWTAFQDDITDAALNRLERLGASYQELAEKIEQRRSGVSQAKHGDGEKQDVNESLKNRNAELVAADALKDAFVQNVTYELRSPLTNIIGFADLLANEGGTLNEKQTAYIDYIRASSVTLGVLIDNILDLASVDAGITELRLEPLDVRELVDKARAGLSATFPQISGGEPINLVVDIEVGLPPLIADGTRLVQILYNLLANAARLSPPDGEIRLTIGHFGRYMRFTVEDEGSNLTEEMKSAILQKADDLGTGRQAGPALGLSIVRTFVELHRGTISFENLDPLGSRIIVNLPQGSAPGMT